MPLAQLLTQDITIVHPGSATDRYQDALPDWSAATRVVVKGRLELSAPAEVTLGRDTVIADWLLVLWPDTAIDAFDRVEFDGQTLEVVGPPAVLSTPRGPHHLEVRLRSVDG